MTPTNDDELSPEDGALLEFLDGPMLSDIDPTRSFGSAELAATLRREAMFLGALERNRLAIPDLVSFALRPSAFESAFGTLRAGIAALAFADLALALVLAGVVAVNGPAATLALAWGVLSLAGSALRPVFSSLSPWAVLAPSVAACALLTLLSAVLLVVPRRRTREFIS